MLALKVLIACLVPLAWAYSAHNELPEVNNDKFFYFGYGSNMLTSRIHIQNPTAQKIGIGILKDYRLDFYGYSDRWNGAPATIVPTDKSVVLGTLWNIDLINLPDIDNQEGVPEGLYFARSVPVAMSNNTIVTARVYLLVEQPSTELSQFANANDVPYKRQPSKTYLQCLVKGAIETKLPLWYYSWLKSIKHNGQVAEDLEEALELKTIQLFD